MSRLDRLTLKGFKSIREMDLNLGDMNVLIGPNGAGKSNLPSFFRFLGAISQQRFQLFVGKEGGANAILHHGRKRTSELVAKDLYPSYRKALHGPQIALRIGLAAIRARCPRFAAWLARLEAR